MTYDPNVPNPIDSPANQAANIRNNFSKFSSIYSSIAAGVLYNHLPFNDPNQGKHAAVIMQAQTSHPAVTDSASIYALNVQSTVNTTPQLFAKIKQFLPNNIPNSPMQLTFDSVNTAGPQYRSFLAGGLVLYFGSSVKGVDITLSPQPNKIINVQAMAHKMTTIGTPSPFDVGVKVTDPTKFQILSTIAGGADIFTWFAIGMINV